MQYDPIKSSLGKVFNKKPFLRKLFYKLLDLLLLRAWYIKRELRKWRKCQANQARILDAGSGFGQYVYYMSTLSKSFTILGVDVKKEQIEDCNNFFTQIGKSQSVTFQDADLTKFRHENQYDLVLSVDVMEHILEDVLVFQNFHASMKSGAMLLISTPSDLGGSDAHDEHDDSFIDEHVRNGYNINEIQDKLKIAGFSKIEALYSYGNAGSLAWKLSMKFPIIILNISKVFFVLLPFYYLIVYPFALLLNFIDLNSDNKHGTGLIIKAWK